MTLVLLCMGAGARFLHRAAGEAVWPFENGIRWFWRGASARFTALVRAQEAVSRLRALEDEVEQLRLDARMLEDLAAENASLRADLGLPPTILRRPLKCEAVSWGGALGWWQSVRINRGARDGVREGDAVVCADGLVGRVRKVHSEASDVMLVTDANARIACALDLPPGTPAVRGILQGGGWGAASPGMEALSFLFVARPMHLDYLDRKALDGDALAARTRVVTSGLSGSVPGGIPVGWLVSAKMDGDGLYGVGEVLPAVDFASLRVMAVLVNAGGAP